LIDEKVRMLVNLHEEKENTNNGTNAIFSNITNIWSTTLQQFNFKKEKLLNG
jgi:hypothetical protein